MVIVAALVCFVLSLAVCIWSYSFVKGYNASQLSSADAADKENASDERTEKSIEEEVHNTAKNSADYAAVIREAIVSLKGGQWVVISAVSALAALCCFALKSNGVGWIMLIKLMISYLALSGATLIDGKIKKIPNVLCAAVIALRIVILPFEWFFARATFKITLIMSLAGLFGCLLLLLLFSILSKGGLGMGDVKLVSAIGFMSGIACALYSMFLGMVVCTLVAVFLLIFRSKSMKDHIPFAPFIFAGFILYLLLTNI